MKLISRLYASRLSAPMSAIIVAEAGCTGRLAMSSFHGLSGGKTCKAARTLSASEVLNSTGWVIAGVVGWAAPAVARAAASRAAEIRFMAGVLTSETDPGDHGPIHTMCGGSPH